MNILLLEQGCPDCARVRVGIDTSKFADDTFFGTNGEKILLFFSCSALATKAFTEVFGMTCVAPVLKLSDGKEITVPEQILAQISRLGYGKH